jgi:hypothetical protein
METESTGILQWTNIVQDCDFSSRKLTRILWPNLPDGGTGRAREYTRECLTIEVGRHMKSIDVLQVLSDQFVERSTCHAEDTCDSCVSARRIWF